MTGNGVTDGRWGRGVKVPTRALILDNDHRAVSGSTRVTVQPSGVTGGNDHDGSGARRDGAHPSP